MIVPRMLHLRYPCYAPGRHWNFHLKKTDNINTTNRQTLWKSFDNVFICPGPVLILRKIGGFLPKRAHIRIREGYKFYIKSCYLHDALIKYLIDDFNGRLLSRGNIMKDSISALLIDYYHQVLSRKYLLL